MAALHATGEGRISRHGRFPKNETFGLRSQLRRAAVSIPSNIAEGQGRSFDKVFRVFLTQARGSLYEVETQLMLAADLEFLGRAVSQQLLTECDEIARILNGLIRSLSAKKKLIDDDSD